MTASRAPFRFGVILTSSGCSRTEWVDKCRRAEQLGYDVIGAQEHLAATSPFPAVMLAAEATERPTIGTQVLNVAFHNPAVLARDVATVDRFIEGRLELGLGTGYARAEFDAAGIPFGTAGSRVDRLEHTIVELEKSLAALDQLRPVQQPRPPLLIGGHGDRVLRIAAERAEIVSFLGATMRPQYGRMVLVDKKTLLERVEFVRSVAGSRIDRLESNVLSKRTVLTTDRRAGLADLRRYGPELTDEQLLELPTLFVGTAREIAEQLHRHREEFGITYFSVMEPSMDEFGKVIEHIR